MCAETAVAEMAFGRLPFGAESPATSFPDAKAEYTAFALDRSTARAFERLAKPLMRNATCQPPETHDITDPVPPCAPSGDNHAPSRAASKWVAGAWRKGDDAGLLGGHVKERLINDFGFAEVVSLGVV